MTEHVADSMDERPSSMRFVVLAWLCGAAAICYASRNGLGVAESTIRAELGLSKEAMGLVMALFFVPYALGQIPGGWLADRLGSRRSIPLFAVGWSIATCVMGWATGLWILVTAWFLNGLFQAGLFPACTNTFSKWFPPTRRAVASGWLASAMSVGSTAASAVAALLIDEIGWRWAFGIFGATGLVWAAGFRRSFRDRPEEHGSVNRGELAIIRQPDPASAPTTQRADHELGREVWLALLLSPATWFICSQQFCRAGGQIFFSTWFPTYLQEARGVSVVSSGVLNSLPLLAIVTGSLLGGIVSDWVLTVTGSRRWARQGVASSCMVTCSAFVVLARTIDHPVLAVLVISAGTLLGAIGGPAAYAITIDMGGRHVAKLFGCMNMVGNLGAASISLGVPRFLKWSGDWEQVLLLFAGLWLAAGLFWLLLNPNGNVFQYSWWRAPERQAPECSRIPTH